MNKTKMIATIGPSSRSKETIKQMILSGVDVITGFSSVATTLSNVGPGFGDIGPTKNFHFYSDFYKLYFSALMLLGRLEFFTILALFSRARHRKEIIKL